MLSKLRAAAILLLLPCFASFAFAAASIEGVVTNRTNNKVSPNDDVVLIRLAQGMQESTRTKTDARGHFTLAVPDDGIHLIRVTHEKANYFKPAPPGTQSVDIDVFDVAAKVKGVSLEAIVIRLQTEPDNKNLKVVQNFFLKNESNPPRTQFSERPFEFTLPEGAVVAGAAAQSTGGMTVQSPPVPLPEKGHYTFLFPIRPGGQTRFQITYTVPYSGSLTMSPLATLSADNVVVILPKSMHFDAGSSPFSSIAEEVEAQTYVARSVPQGKTTSFTVSGTGQLPRQTTQPGDASAQDQGNGPASGTPPSGADPNADAGSNTTDRRPGGGLGKPIGSPDPLSKYKWWILGGLGLALAAGAGFLLSRPSAGTPSMAGSAISPAPVPNSQPSTASLMHVLRDELFSLEAERLTGKITQAQYERLKPALETVLQNALEREQRKSGSSTQV